MPTYIFDGTTDINAAQGDVVIFTANPRALVNVTENNGRALFSTADATLSIAGGFAGINPSNFLIPGGTALFGEVPAEPVDTPTNLIVGLRENEIINVNPGEDGVSTLIVAGTGFADPDDGDTNITIAGTGAFTVYANGGADNVDATDLEDGAQAVIYGGVGDDTIAAGHVHENCGVGFHSIDVAIYGGEGADDIEVATDGEAVIYGGAGEVDPDDGDDEINFAGTGTFAVYANGGNDSVFGWLQEDAQAAIFGGMGDDAIIAFGLPIAVGIPPDLADISLQNVGLTLYGGEGQDFIIAATNGTAEIYGGTGEVDPEDGADVIGFLGAGEFTVYANGGTDVVLGVGQGDEGRADVHGGVGDDNIVLLAPHFDDDDLPCVSGVIGGAFGGIEGIGLQEQVSAFLSGLNLSDSLDDHPDLSKEDLADLLFAFDFTTYGGEGQDLIVVATNGEARIYGGNSEVDPEDGADVILLVGAGTFEAYGNGGNDILVWVGFGEEEQSRIFGGVGDDIIVLLSDNVAVAGNEGADIFSIGPNLFADEPNPDLIATITDFTKGEDKIDVSLLWGEVPDAIATMEAKETLEESLTAARAKQIELVQFNFQGDTYLVFNDLEDAEGIAIRLAGVSSVDRSDFTSINLAEAALEWANAREWPELTWPELAWPEFGWAMPV